MQNQKPTADTPNAENAATEALPCPFCLSADLAIAEPTRVECRECGAAGPDFMKSPRVAVNAWNNRGDKVDGRKDGRPLDAIVSQTQGGT